MRVGPYSIANDVRLRRQQFGGAVLLVEGPTDSIFLKRFILAESCMVIPSFGKENAIEALRILLDANVPGVLSIVDADFDKLDESFPKVPGLLFFDHHDLEVMLLDSPALEALLAECGSDKKITAFEAKTGGDVRSAVLERAREVGILRWYSIRENLSLRFQGLNYASFMDARTFAIDVERLVSAVRNHSQRHDLDSRAIVEKLAGMRALGADPRMVACGHDAIEVLSLGLRRALGSMNHAESQPSSLERNLRLAYDIEYFRGTQLYASIRNWQDENPPFVVVE